MFPLRRMIRRLSWMMHYFPGYRIFPYVIRRYCRALISIRHLSHCFLLSLKATRNICVKNKVLHPVSCHLRMSLSGNHLSILTVVTMKKRPLLLPWSVTIKKTLFQQITQIQKRLIKSVVLLDVYDIRKCNFNIKGA